MVNKLLVVFLLGSSMAFGQLVKVEVNLDSIANIIEKKDKEIKMWRTLNEELHMNYKAEKVLNKSLSDSLGHYKAFYIKVHKKLSPRLIARIKEDE